jgi:hypothetical protein
MGTYMLFCLQFNSQERLRPQIAGTLRGSRWQQLQLLYPQSNVSTFVHVRSHPVNIWAAHVNLIATRDFAMTLRTMQL